MRDFIEIFGIMLGIAAVVVMIILPPAYFLEKHVCFTQTESFEARYGIFEGCQIQNGGKWVQWKSYRVTEVETDD